MSIQVGNIDFGFEPTDKVHMVSHRFKHKSVYVDNRLNGEMRYDTMSKVTTFIIPISLEQYNRLNQINQNYCKNAPYDYAFFGMRCASAAQEILGQIGVVKQRRKFWNITSTFYPKWLRKRMFKLAAANKYQVIKRKDRDSRKWEND